MRLEGSAWGETGLRVGVNLLASSRSVAHAHTGKLGTEAVRYTVPLMRRQLRASGSMLTPM